MHIDRKGYALLHIDKYDEDYLITMPKIHIEGFMTGSLFPELSGSSYIRSSTGYTAKIDYLCKGWLGGKRNGFNASLCHDSKPKLPLYTAEGQWSDGYVIKDMRTQKEVERFNSNTAPRTRLMVAPVEEQHPLESRRAWQPVVNAIHRGDIFAVGHEKTKIEQEQREMRKREKRNGEEFPRRYFTRAKEDPLAEKLAEGIPGDTSMKGDFDGHHGLWMWDEEKYRRITVNTLNGIKSPTRTRFESVDSGIAGISLRPGSTGSSS